MDFRRVVEEVFSQIKGVRFDVVLWDNTHFNFGGKGKPVFTLHFKTKNAAKRLLSEGALGFGESYMDGSLDITGDIKTYLRQRHQFKHIKRTPRLILGTLLAKRTAPKSNADAIARHYDAGNEFFSLLLDTDTMSYSNAVYTSRNQTLGEAQQNKLELVTDWLNLKPASKILDLGSGWGGFAEFVAENRNWRVDGYTLSKKQLKYARKHAKTIKHTKNITYSFKDMTKELPKKSYDAIVAIESIEHVGENYLQKFFENTAACLKPGGKLYVQATSQYKPRRVDRWILKYVFPGGYLPPIGELTRFAGESGLRIIKLQDDTDDYIRTLTQWVANLENNKDKVIKMYDESFYRLWYLWLNGAIASFEVGYMSSFKILLQKP